jgi:hypothetical protein
MSTVTVAQYLGSSATLDSAGSIVISDSAANLAAALPLLSADPHVTSIVDADGAALTVSVGTLLTSARALAILVTPGGGHPSLRVVDTAAKLSAAFADLFSTQTVRGIVINDQGSLMLPSALFYQALSAGLYGRALSISNLGGGNVHVIPVNTLSVGALLTYEARHYASPTTVLDTTADVFANLAHLSNDPNVTGIYLSDMSTMTLSAGEARTYVHALDEIVSLGLTLDIVDTAANLSANLDLLASLPGVPGVSSLLVTDNAAVTVSAAQLVFDARVLADLSNKNGAAYGLNLVDTAANVSGVISRLVGDSHLAGIEITDGQALTLSGSLYSSAGVQAVLAKVEGVHSVQVNWGAAKPYDTEVLTYDAQGHLATDATFNQAGGVQTVTALEGGLSFTGGARPTNWSLTGTGDSFLLHAGFGADAVTGYQPGADSFSLDHTEVANFAALMADAHSDGHGDVVITFNPHDSLTLNGVTLAQLQAHAGDWHFI